MKRKGTAAESVFAGHGSGGGYFYPVLFWVGLAEAVLDAARGALREHQASKASEKRIQRWLERQPRSLNAAPDEADVAAQWRRTRGSLVERLRFGSLLLDLEPTVDSTPIYRLNRAGTREVIVARNPGLKGWLRQHCREVGYVTAMRYKSLARKVQVACGLPREVPLAWILPGGAAPRDAQGAPSAKALAAARTVLLDLLAGCGAVTQLSARLDERLGTMHRRLASPRLGISPAGRRKMAGRAIEKWLEPVLSQVAAAAAGGGLDPARRAFLRKRLLAVVEELGSPAA